MEGSAGVNRKEVDLSTRIPSFPGVYGGMPIPAVKGIPFKPRLVTDESDLLKYFTQDERIEIGYDNAYFSALAFLQKSNKLWVVRACLNALYGGLVVKSSTSSYDNFSLPVGMSDPTAYVFDELPDVPGVKEKTEAKQPAGTSLDGKYWELWGYNSGEKEYYVWFNTGSSTEPTHTGTGIEVAVLVGDTAIQVATKVKTAIDLVVDFGATIKTGEEDTVVIENAKVGLVTDAVDGDAGVTIDVITQGVNPISDTDDCLLIYGSNPGNHNNDIRLKIVTYEDEPDIVKEEDAFLVYVYKSANLNVPIEDPWLCSRKQKKDGYGKNIYVEDVLEGSNYIRAIDNVLIDESVYPKTQTIAPLAFVGGDDGDVVTDTEMILAAEKLSNVDDLNLTVLMDGGWTTPAYQKALDTIVKTRGDSVVLDSIPYSAEASNDYLNEIVDYRKITLNLNSSYSAIYTPHAKVYDKFNNRNLYVSPDGYAGAAISLSASNFEIWYPPAGWTRGKMNVLDLRRRFKKGERDILYDAGINPNRFKPGKGIAIWGQKNMLTRPSLLNRLNVRLLMCVIGPANEAALDDYTFDLNDKASRSLATSKIRSYMDKIVAKRGCTDFRPVSDKTNNSDADIDAHKMNVWLFVKPTPSLEEIPFSIIITSTGTSFELAEQLL